MPRGEVRVCAKRRVEGVPRGEVRGCAKRYIAQNGEGVCVKRCSVPSNHRARGRRGSKVKNYLVQLLVLHLQHVKISIHG